MFLEIKDKPWFPLKLGQLYLLGKQIFGNHTLKNNFIELEDEEDVSQRHCVIEVNGREEAFVFDLFSLKGTLLNNKILNSLEKIRLSHGDILKLGKSEIKYIDDKGERCPNNSLKNTSSFIASSPNVSTQLEAKAKFLVPSFPLKNLNASSSTLSLSNRRSDSFIIPETQCCPQKNSLNGSDLSLAESNPDESGKITFNFGNSSADEDDFCIPETQDVLQTAVLSNKNNTSGEGNTKATIDGSQFRICTQDYNEGFGEEESPESLHSQIIPLIKHQTVTLNCTDHSNLHPVNESCAGEEEKEMSALKWSISKTDQSRADCATPDIFDFDGVDETKEKKCAETNDIDKTSKVQADSLVDRDEEDFLLTQAPPAASSVKKLLENKSWSELEKPCLEIDREEVISLSDKENRCPVTLETVEDLPPTQLFEVPVSKSQSSIFCRKSISSAIKPKTENNTTNTSLATEIDEEDFVLTQAVSSSSSAFSKNSIIKCLNSTLLDENIKTQNAAHFFAEIEELKLKPTSSSSETAFKKPDKDFSVLKKTSSAASTISENDLDLLMCTPQLIKDNLFLGKSEDLKKNILAAKNINLCIDETEEENDDDDDQSDLVKLINVPKDSTDFDKLLPHLNRSHQEAKSTNEAQKIYKFNIFFGKEQDEKLSNATNSKSSVLSRDERHAVRDKEKEISRRKERTKAKDEKSKADKGREVAYKCKEKQTESKEKIKNKDSRSSKLKKNEIEFSKAPESAEKKANKKQETSKYDSNSGKGDNYEKERNQSTSNSENSSKNSAKHTRLRKRCASSDKRSEKESEAQATPAKRVTRSRSKLLDIPPTDVADDMDSISTQPFVRTTRNRSKSELQESQGSQTSKSSSQKSISQRKKTKAEHNVNTNTKNTERKRKAVATEGVAPVKLELKRLRSSESLTLPVSISMTMVDQDMFKDLFKHSKGLWIIAKNCFDSDVLVMDKAVRTFKFILAMARGIPIVTSEYLKKINESKSANEVRINDYLYVDPEFEKKYNFSLAKSLQTARNHKVFKDYEFMMTPNISPNPEEIKAIVEASGGYVHDKTPPQPKDNQKLYLVTAITDKKNWHKYRRLNNNIKFVATEAIMSTILTQNCEPMNKYIF